MTPKEPLEDFRPQSENINHSDTTFIYALLDPRDNRIRYVGKSNNPSLRLRNHVKFARQGKTYRTARWIQSLLSLGLYPLYDVIEQCNRANWKDREIWWIQELRLCGVQLTNHSDGGYGSDPDDDARAKMRAAKLGRPSPRLGQHASDETKALQSESAKSRWAMVTDDERAHWSARCKQTSTGKHPSLETRKKMSTTAKERNAASRFSR